MPYLGKQPSEVSSVAVDTTTGTFSGEVAAASLDISGNVDVDGVLETDALSIASTTITSTAAELNILDGVTATAAELNIMDGVTSTTAELNILDGVTSTAAELNLLDGVSGLVQADLTKLAAVDSTAAELNILDGVTSTAAELNILDGVTSTAAELNILDGVTSTATELNLLDGVTSTTAELNILDGVTSTATELNLLDGVTSTTAELNILDGVTSTAAELNILDGVTSTTAELNALDGITAVVGELNALDIGSTAVGTAVASKAVILDSSKDYTGIRNLTITGELDAATLDISGAIDVAGTANLDVVDIDGTLNVQGETTLQTHLNMGDEDKIKLGASGDLEIFHDGNNSFIKDTGTGSLYLQASDSVFITNASGNENKARFDTDGAVTLYHNNAAKIATASDGVNVTGDVDVSVDLNLGGNLVYTGSAQIQSTAQTGSVVLSGGNNSNNGANITAYGPSHASLANVTRFRVNATETMRIDAAGHITKPLQPAFNVRPSSNQNNVAEDETIVFGTERFDVGANFSKDGGVANAFTAPVTGKYQFTISLRVDNIDTAANWNRIELVTSNYIYLSSIIDLGGLSADPVHWHFNFSVLADLDAGDTALVKWGQNVGATQVDIDTQSSFSGYLVC